MLFVFIASFQLRSWSHICVTQYGWYYIPSHSVIKALYPSDIGYFAISENVAIYRLLRESLSLFLLFPTSGMILCNKREVN